MTRRILLFTLLALCAFAALAGRYDKQLEASMLVTGELVVAPDGTVKSYKLDRADALPPEPRKLLEEAIPGWELDVEKSDGSPLQSPTTVKMSVQLLARPVTGADNEFRITIQDTTFRDPKEPVQVEAKGELTPPKYPMSAAQSGVSGIVYVVLRLNSDGTVAQAHVEQINMTVLTNERTLRRFSKVLSEAAVGAAQQWTFNIAPERLANPEPVGVRVPVEFLMTGKTPEVEYGRWHAYVPGPYAPIPWRNLTGDSGDSGGVEGGIGAMVPGQVYSMDASIRLRDSPAGT
ncbi:MAG: energy transducer TonB [Pseudomonadota bacterium]|nr:energy transducer TonB [Pseudomonadota bacterium]